MNLTTRQLPLQVDGYVCVGGPFAGAKIFLTEYSPNTARIECSAQNGRYVSDNYGRLIWQPDKPTAEPTR